MNAAHRILLGGLVTVLNLGVVTPALAQSLTVQTSLSEPTVAVGDVVTLEVTVTSRVSGRMRVQVPPVDGLTEVSRGQSQSQSISLSSAGQQVLNQNVYTIDYRAERPGRFVIGPIAARVGKRTARSTPVTVRVQDAGAAAANATAPKPNKVDEPDTAEGSLFLRYRLDQATPYLGQAVLLDLEIISEPNLGFQVEETTGLPEVEGFWTQILEQPRRLRPRRITIGKKQYVSYRIWRAALFPLKAGQLTLAPVGMQFSQGAGLFRTGKRFRRRTRPVRLEVKPLPSVGRPKDFVSTNVGRYKLTATVDQRRVPAGKALLYTLRLSGKGNIASAKLPVVDKIPNFRVFAPTVRDDVKADANGIRGFKEAEYLLMPQKGGRLTIPSVDLPVFDPAAGKYETLKTKSIRVRVDGTPDPVTAPEPPAPAASKTDAQDNSLALRPLRFTSDLTSATVPPWHQAWFWFLLIAPGAASGGFGAWRWSKKRDATAEPKNAHKAALRHAHATLDSARDAVESGALADAHARVADALRTYGSQALGVSLQGLTLEAVATETKARGLKADHTADLVRLLEAADYARYAPSQLTSAATHSDINRAEELVSAFTDLAENDQ